MPSPAEESARLLWIKLPAYFIATKCGREFLGKLEQALLSAHSAGREEGLEEAAQKFDAQDEGYQWIQRLIRQLKRREA